MGRNIKDELIKERNRLSAILDGTNIGTWEWNVQTGETSFNARWAEMIGYSHEEMLPASIEIWERYTHPDDLRIAELELEKHFRKESERYECEIRMKHKAGHWVWVLDRGKVASWTAAGQPEWMYGTHQEITERKVTELRMSALLDNINEGIIHGITELTIEVANKRFCELFGYPLEQISPV